MKLDPARIKPTDHEVTDYSITVEMGTKVEDVLRPEFLANVAPRLTPYSKIRVRVDDGSWYAELLVLSVGRTWAKCEPLFVLELTASDTDQTQAEHNDGYKVQFRGEHHKWCAVRKEDGAIVKDQMQTKREAEGWLSEYLRTVG